MKKVFIAIIVLFLVGCSGEEFNSDSASTTDAALDDCLDLYTKASVLCATTSGAAFNNTDPQLETFYKKWASRNCELTVQAFYQCAPVFSQYTSEPITGENMADYISQLIDEGLAGAKRR